MKGFDKLKKEVIESDLCTRCGTCVGICPVETLACQDGRVVDAGHGCVQCGMCSAVCPGKEFPMNEWSEKLFQKPYDTGRLFGSYQGIYTVSSHDAAVRAEGSSGGIVTQMLLSLLEWHKIEGAVVVGEKENDPSGFVPFIATSTEQIRKAAQSKYVVLPVNQVIREIKESGKKIAYVGLPCQIQGMRKAMAENAWLAEQIVVLISLFCGFNMEEEATEYLISKSKIPKSKIAILRYRHRRGKQTGFYIKGTNDREFFINKHGYTFMNLLFSPKRCWQCYDYSGEFADLSVGDAWEKGSGFSRVIVRTQTGSEIVKMLESREVVKTEPCKEDVIVKTQKKVVTYKKQQIAVRRERMKPFPDYGVDFEQCKGKIRIKGVILYTILSFFKNPVGRLGIRILPFRLLVKVSERIKGKEVIQSEN